MTFPRPFHSTPSAPQFSLPVSFFRYFRPWWPLCFWWWILPEYLCGVTAYARSRVRVSPMHCAFEYGSWANHSHMHVHAFVTVSGLGPVGADLLTYAHKEVKPKQNSFEKVLKLFCSLQNKALRPWNVLDVLANRSRHATTCCGGRAMAPSRCWVGPVSWGDDVCVTSS